MVKEIPKETKVNADEQIGFHKGAITTLLKEREEMIKVLQVVEALLKAHIEGLKKLGVDITQKLK